MTRKHRLEILYPDLWVAIDGAIRDAAAAHPDIEIPGKRRASIVKRAVGQVLAVMARAGVPAVTSGADAGGTAGVADVRGHPQLPDRGKMVQPKPGAPAGGYGGTL